MTDHSPFLVLDNVGAFGPQMVHEMATALDDVCRALCVPDDAMEERRIIAMRLIDLVRGGMTDAEALCGRVLREAHVAAPTSLLLH